MGGLLLVTSLAALTLLAILWGRLRAATGVVEFLERVTPDRLGYLGPLCREVRRSLDEGLLSPASGGGLSDLAVSSLEQGDPYGTVQELIAALPELARDRTLSGRESFVKALYQLQDTLDLSDEGMAAVLEPISRDMRGLALGERRVGSVELVPRGARVDTAHMWPINQGSKVRQPLGVVVRDEAGKVLGLAKVACAT